MEISELSKLPINVIANIAKLCLENDFEYEQPYNIDFDDNFEKLNDSTRWTGVQLNSILDVEFMAKFIEMNRDLLIDWIDFPNSDYLIQRKFHLNLNHLPVFLLIYLEKLAHQRVVVLENV